MYDRHVAVTRGGDGTLGGEGAPRAGHEVEHVRVLQVPIAVMSAV